MNTESAKNELFHLIFTVGRVKDTIACDQGLFSPDNKDFDALVAFAPEVFSVIQKAFTDRVATLFGKLLDKTKGTTSLPQWVNNYVDKPLKSQYLNGIKKIELTAKRILAIRHNGVSHANREYINGVDTLEAASHAELITLAESIETLLNQLRIQYFPDIGYGQNNDMREHVAAMMEKIKRLVLAEN